METSKNFYLIQCRLQLLLVLQERLDLLLMGLYKFDNDTDFIVLLNIEIL